MFFPRNAFATLLRAMSILALLSLGSGCAADTEVGNNANNGARVVVPLILNFNQQLVVPTSVLSFRLEGTQRTVADRAEVQFVGADGTGRTIDVLSFVDETEREGDQGNIIVRVPVDDTLWASINPSPNARFTGTIEVRLLDEIGVFAEGALGDQSLDFRSEIVPEVDAVPGGVYFVNQHIRVGGEGFLRPEEGTTQATVSGVITYVDGRESRTITSEPVAMIWDGRRNEGIFPIDPAVFGVAASDFSGSLAFDNRLKNGTEFAGNAQAALDFSIEQSFLGTIDPAAGSRGQKITFRGRGLVSNSEGERFYGLVLRFDGVLAYDDGGELDLTGENALERAPDLVLNEEAAESSVWYEIVDRELQGLGAKPGVFTGEIVPILFDRFGEEEGVSVPLTFRVLPSRQVVHLKYLPAFYKALEKFGLQNVERDIRQRILQVVKRDYEGTNVDFQEDLPTQFSEFATIEIGGPDPTGGNKFGYDNTCNPETETCKDTDNLFLADYLGGVNRASAEEFNTPYGGIFIESFDYFSETLNPDVPDTSESFDRVMKPFMLALDGSPVKGTEWPDGPRSAEIAEAIHMFGSVIGNTISHEIGHSIGLAFYPADRIRPGEAFHNRIPCDNCIMDPGAARPFEERAELDGVGPAVFNERNRDYLLEILPATD